jgi:hypothetical protein
VGRPSLVTDGSIVDIVVRLAGRARTAIRVDRDANATVA